MEIPMVIYYVLIAEIHHKFPNVTFKMILMIENDLMFIIVLQPLVVWQQFLVVAQLMCDHSLR